MIRSILDTDLYKFTTSYAYFKLYPQAIGTFTFNDRAKTQFDDDFLEDLKAELKALERIALSEDEFQYMIRCCKYIPQNYFEWMISPSSPKTGTEMVTMSRPRFVICLFATVLFFS